MTEALVTLRVPQGSVVGAYLFTVVARSFPVDFSNAFVVVVARLRIGQ